jgi:hypothetical protein
MFVWDYISRMILLYRCSAFPVAFHSHNYLSTSFFSPYRSRVPPFMKPNKVRSLLEKYGEVTRLYLAEEGRIMRLFECNFR